MSNKKNTSDDFIIPDFFGKNDNQSAKTDSAAKTKPVPPKASPSDTVEYDVATNGRTIRFDPVKDVTFDTNVIDDISKQSSHRSEEECLPRTFISRRPSAEVSDIFAESVKSYRVSAPTEAQNGQRRKRFYSLVINSLALAVCVSVFLYCAYLVVVRTIENYTAESEYDSIRVDSVVASAIAKPAILAEPSGMLTLYNSASTESEDNDYTVEDVAPDKMEEFKSYYKNYLSLRAKYPDMYGWIVLTDTKLDYPLMRNTKDNNYYLNYNYSGQLSRSGSCFADMMTRDDYMTNFNLLTYGHCMQNGTMYRSIKLWYDSSTREEDAETMNIYVYSKDGLYIYDIFSTYRSTDASFYGRMVFYSDSDYYSWLNKIYKKSVLKKTSEFSSNSRVITMITCSNVTGNPNERYVLHGILTGFIPSEQLLN